MLACPFCLSPFALHRMEDLDKDHVLLPSRHLLSHPRRPLLSQGSRFQRSRAKLPFTEPSRATGSSGRAGSLSRIKTLKGFLLCHKCQDSSSRYGRATSAHLTNEGKTHSRGGARLQLGPAAAPGQKPQRDREQRHCGWSRSPRQRCAKGQVFRDRDMGSSIIKENLFTLWV